MPQNQLANHINKLSYQLLESQIAIDINHIVATQYQERTIVSWKGISENIVFRDYMFGTVAEYIAMLASRNFSILLKDGSILQTTYFLDGDEVIGHRLAYYPCPYSIDEDDIEIGLIDSIESIPDRLIKERVLLRSPIRFDYDPDNANDNHPESHIHIINEECRIPVFSSLSINHFFDFIFRNFYPETWSSFDFNNALPPPQHRRCVREVHRSRLFFDCYH